MCSRPSRLGVPLLGMTDHKTPLFSFHTFCARKSRLLRVAVASPPKWPQPITFR
jgi:hypothetical protein